MQAETKTILKPRLVFLLLAALALGACQSDPLKKAPLAQIELGKKGLQSIIDTSADEVMIPRIQQWQKSALLMQKSTMDFCQQPNEDGLVDLQKDFKQLYLDWNGVMLFDFGPLRDNLFFPKIHFVESMRQRGRDYSHSIRDNIKRRLEDDKALHQAYFNKLKFNLVGMPAIEILLFDGANDVLLKSYQQPRKCQLLQGMVDLNERIASYVLTGWTSGHQGKTGYRELFVSAKLEGGEQPLSKLLYAMQDYLRYITQRKLNGRLDAQLSDMSWPNLAAGLDAVEMLYSGNQSNLSIRGYLWKAARKQEVKDFDEQMNLARIAIENRDKAALAKAYSAMIGYLEKPIPKALGMNLGMNFVDGD
ncbi:imelysin family protein [Thiomicrorhabdus sediminis]|uniref:Imelysin-like domain-containing protein n=1 Tax=Thiomicrorhabdus sediminis TaxID=2580412 RepID=A0A4P9K4B4_9GAMM|nr:imelysin family protein [Thiomicrorhabdus sediminis]QCU89240.1 hypothetical protein FE785_00645 [Thiomicrorhabdus sediminis]